VTLAAGTKLGPYEILAPLGVGGMGEVYRAKDARLGREIALKVLPEEFSSDKERLVRFEQEARAASALNHPNILTVHDVGSETGRSFIAMELVDGKSLRELLEGGALPLRKGLDLAAQIADGLAKAHSAGIVHRDLKPENVMVSKDGFAKILDFGLAKLSQPSREDLSSLPTAAPATTPGMVLGTIGYMSPEQAAGRTVDYRSDQFSFGAIGYEMATGQKPFARNTSAETLTAIIREEPEPIGELNPKVPAPVRWIIERCLAKDPEDRYASTKDLARDLKSVRDHLSEASTSGVIAAPGQGSRRGRYLAAGIAIAVVAGLTGAYVGRRASPPREPPKFQRLTFERGTIYGARFTGDGQTIVFSAAWNGSPIRLYTARLGTPGESRVDLPDANLFSVTPSGELALGLNRRPVTSLYSAYTLARAPLTGGAPREILEDVISADWSPDGARLAVGHQTGGTTRIEFPIGKTLYETGGWVSHLRVSPDGSRIAFLDHPNASDGGAVACLDSSGRKTVLSTGWASLEGLAWRRDGGEVWFTGTRAGAATHIHGVTLDGRERLILRTPDEMTLWDVEKDGRALFTEDDWRAGIIASAPGAAAEHDLSAMDYSLVRDISPDGKFVSFDDSGEGGGAEGAVFLGPTDGSPPVRLGTGTAGGISPDGRWVVSSDLEEKRFVLLPTGPGQPRTIPCGAVSCGFPTFSADGKSVIFQGGEPGHGPRIYIRPADGSGSPRAVSPEGVGFVTRVTVSPDGRHVASIGADGRPKIYTLTGGPPADVPGGQNGDHPTQWGPNGKSLYVCRSAGTGIDVYRIDIASGRRELWKHVTVSDAAGIVTVPLVIPTRDGRAYAYTYVRVLSTLFETTGLR
jgi:Tol biopolymer transport system component